MKLAPQKSTVLGLIIITQKIKFSISDQEFSHENPNVDSIPIPINRPRVDTLKLSSSNINFKYYRPIYDKVSPMSLLLGIYEQIICAFLILPMSITHHAHITGLHSNILISVSKRVRTIH